LESLHALVEVPDLARLTAGGVDDFVLHQAHGAEGHRCSWGPQAAQAACLVCAGEGARSCQADGEALSALRSLKLCVSLKLIVGNYARGCCAFTALSRSLPCLQQLQVLRLGSWIKDEDWSIDSEALWARDVLAIGRALKAWPLPLLHDVYDHAGKGLCLSWIWQALGCRQRQPTGPTRRRSTFPGCSSKRWRRLRA
jgi:hypothetical protein